MIQKYTLGIGLSLGLAFALSACGSAAPAPQTVTLMAQMIAGASSGQAGSAVLTDNGDMTTTVKVTTTGGTDTTAMQLAHIHVGKCGSNGAPMYTLTSVSGGASTTTVMAPLSGLTGGKFYINVHNSANPGNIQACGDIQ